jgi:hypothetical protein
VSVAKDAIGWDRFAGPPAGQRPEIEYVAATQLKAPPAFPDAALPTPLPVASAAAATTQPAAAARPLANASAASIQEKVEPLLEQLRQLGVMEYVLERWGDGSLYRFRCAMPLGAGPELTQQFEAVTADPEASVEEVVAQIASWQMARRNERLTR